jgi:hypothetical protein
MSGRFITLAQVMIGAIILKGTTQLSVIRNTTMLLQTTSSKRQRRKKLRWKVQPPSKKVVLFILWRRQRTYNKDVPSHDPEIKGNS